jgi:hypothetical protein
MIRAVVRAQYLRLAAAPEEPRQLRHDVARPDRTVDATPERDAGVLVDDVQDAKRAAVARAPAHEVVRIRLGSCQARLLLRRLSSNPPATALPPWPLSGFSAGFYLQPFRDSGRRALYGIGVKPPALLVASAAPRESRT